MIIYRMRMWKSDSKISEKKHTPCTLTQITLNDDNNVHEQRL